MLIFKESEKASSNSVFKLHLGWFIVFFVLIFAGISGFLLPIFVQDFPVFVSIVSAILLAVIAILLLLEFVSVIKALKLYYENNFTVTTKFNFPELQYIFEDDDRQSDKNLANKAEKSPQSPQRTLEINLVSVFWKIGGVFIAQITGSLLTGFAIMKGLMYTLMAVLFIALIIDIKPAYVGWWHAMNGRSVSWSLNSSLLVINISED